MPSASALQARFTDWCSAAGVPQPLAASTWRELASRYGEPHRHYHTLDHIAGSLSHLDGCPDDASFAIEGAIWFHDAVYDPLAKDNEAASVALFRELLGEAVDCSLVATIERLVLATDFRIGPGGPADEALMVDIDLAILGAPRANYDTYRKSIRREYSSVPENAFRLGRAKVIRHFLERPIYITPRFSGFESPARDNLGWELQLLDSGEPM
jgi:predicted metal-dependent HD superfamily phosphohydrolase